MAEFTTAFGQDGPEITKPSSAMFLTTCAVCAKALNNDEARECGFMDPSRYILPPWGVTTHRR